MVGIIKETVNGINVVSADDELLSKRKIFLTNLVDAETSNELLKKLMYLNEVDSKAPITLYINSPGGDVYSGLAVYDFIQLMKAPLKTVCIGCAGSMGAILFLAGDEREMLPHTQLMIHDPSYARLDVGGKKPHEIQHEVDSLNKTRENLAKIIADRTGMSLDEVYKITANDTFYDVKAAIEFGLATAVCTEV